MAPTLSKIKEDYGTNQRDVLVQEIANIYKTMKKTERRNLDTSERANKCIKENTLHLDKTLRIRRLENSDRFSESLNWPARTNNQVNFGGGQQYATLGSKQSPKRRDSLSSCSENGEANKTPLSNNRFVRTVIFKTLDRLFQVSNKPSRPTEKSLNQTNPEKPCTSINEQTLSLADLKLLNQNTVDTLQRKEPFLPDCKPLLEEAKTDITLECSYNGESSSDSDSCWEFMEPLKIVNVEYETIEHTTFKESCTGKENEPGLSMPGEDQKPKPRFQKKTQRGSTRSKIEKIALERQAEKVNIVEPTIPEIITENVSVPARPDSPLPKIRNNEKNFSSAKSLPNLIEVIYEIESSPTSTLSDCGTATFTRNISYCPSSTLSKSTPSFSANHVFEDDACSTSSSFSSLQRMPHESTLPVPSALCKDVLVNPISVPVQPIINYEQEARVGGISLKAFEKLTEIYKADIVHEDAESKVACPLDSFETVTLASTPSTDTETSQRELSSTRSESVINETILSSVYASAPPPPPLPVPPPPPPPPSSLQNTTIIRGLLPLPVFTQKQKGKCIFNEPRDVIKIDGRFAKDLKEKFPLKTPVGRTCSLNDKPQEKELSPEEKKFLLNIELFLKTHRISSKDTIDKISHSIKVLNPRHCDVKTEWFIGVAQSLPKADELTKMRKNASFEKLQSISSLAGLLVSELLQIKSLREKLNYIKYSLDFEDGFTKLTKWADAFIGVCEAITNSDKFVAIINVILGLLQELNPVGQSMIYGFDIQCLTKLATKTSSDGNSTLLHFVIEYILDKPSLVESVDFYKGFNDLPDVTKTTIAEMQDECRKWKVCLEKYTTQIQKELENPKVSASDLAFAKQFSKEAEEKLNFLDRKLSEAQQSFNVCKERFGLTNSNTNEVIFFESLSKFVIVYEKTYKQIVAQRERAERMNTGNRRLSMGFLNQGSTSDTAPPIKALSRQKSCIEFRNSRAAEPKPTKKNRVPIVPQRKKGMFQEFPNVNIGPESCELEKGLHKLLAGNVDNDNGLIKKTKRKSLISSKIPLFGRH